MFRVAGEFMEENKIVKLNFITVYEKTFSHSQNGTGPTQKYMAFGQLIRDNSSSASQLSIA
jgi:hypothetical protein